MVTMRVLSGKLARTGTFPLTSICWLPNWPSPFAPRAQTLPLLSSARL
jgi:hypothetical protein